MSPINLHAYARSRDWVEQEIWNDRATIFTLAAGDSELEILVPLRDSFADYAERVSDAIRTLALAENRSETEIYLDLMEVGSDVIRCWSSLRPTTESLSLSEYSNLYSNVHDMISAAARAVEAPRAAYRGKLSKDISDYLSQVRPIAASTSSYSLILHSPVPLPLYEQGRMFDYGETQVHLPFSRRATLKLAEALDHTTSALTEVCKTSDLSIFEYASSYGVSANLCSAISRLAKGARGIEIGLYWAYVRGGDPPRQYSFSNNSVDILDDAAKELRDIEPFLDHSLLAYVVRLDREPDEFDGRAYILADIDGSARRLYVEFDESVFSQVIGAFENRHQIEVVGDVRKKGQMLILDKPRHLKIVEDGHN